RLGEFDVLVGINLLREGLDIPEVTLVAILDADNEGFLRSERSIIQTAGRAARNIDGTVILYANRMTDSMQRAIGETQRRRQTQVAYNQIHHITPQSIQKNITDILAEFQENRGFVLDLSVLEEPQEDFDIENEAEFDERIGQLEKAMKAAAAELSFEKAAALRDQIKQLRQLQLRLP
ncbi:MAG TPA: excinuclease ABC subunit B, partial [Syntrophobacteraceae bacterium]|nr:excinuclease ABC subunit B [Syntrophobacteraceae bacterium]